MALFCSKCNRTISPSSMASTIMGNNYHTYCLTCSNCSKPLWGKPFRQTKQGLFCDGDCEAENNVLTNNSDSIVLPTIPNNNNGGRQPLQMQNKSNSLILSGGGGVGGMKPKHTAMEDNVGKLMLDPNENGMINHMNHTVNPRQQQMMMQMPPTSTSPPSMPPANEQMMSNGQKAVPYPQPVQSQYQYPYNHSANQLTNTTTPLITQRSMNPLYQSQERQLTNQSMTPHQNSFMGAVRQNPSGPFQRSTIKPYKNYHAFNEAPIYEKEFDVANGPAFYCAVCKRQITSNKCTFNDRSYHADCFKCDSCNIDLFNMKKVVADPSDRGKFCEPCFSKEFGPYCAKCSQPITPHMLSTGYEDKLFHRECFQCARCKRSLAELEFRKSGNIYICRNCF